ncbi:hypothetical protein H1R20_g4514, partial [Candolleomyces eurysporus]
MTSQYRITILERYCVSLEEFMRTPGILPLMESQVRAIGVQVITGLDFIHRSGIVHTDIKPANVALINNETLEYVDYSRGYFVKRSILKYPLIKIVDYDEAFIVSIGPGRHSIGSNGYRAPEIILGPSWSFGVDVFSLGCLMAEIHIGRPLFRTTSTRLGYLVQLQVILGGFPLPFLVWLRANGYETLLTGTNELRSPVSEAECMPI